MTLDLRYPAVSDLRDRARQRIPGFIFEYLDSATGREDQKRRNEAALDAILFETSVLHGPLEYDLSTRFLGRDYPLPFGIAPVGMSGAMWPGAERLLASTAARAGIPYCMSTVATVLPETLAPHIGDQGWFQMYMPRDPGIRADMAERARAAGFHTLVLTVDVPADSRRERQRRANLSMPMRFTPRMVWQMMRRPEWTLGTLREGPPRLRLLESYSTGGGNSSVAHAGHAIYGSPTWEDVAALREIWHGPFIVKGILSPEAARRLADAGVDAVWVSNHTGRQFDGGPTSISRLPAIRDALPETPLIFDSGIRGGLDILRAIALGADFVMLGRAFHYAVAALGEKGPSHLIHVLKADIESCMGQMGITRPKDAAERLCRESANGQSEDFLSEPRPRTPN